MPRLGIGFSLGFGALGLGERLERIGFITTKPSREHPLQKLGRSPETAMKLRIVQRRRNVVNPTRGKLPRPQP